MLRRAARSQGAPAEVAGRAPPGAATALAAAVAPVERVAALGRAARRAPARAVRRAQVESPAGGALLPPAECRAAVGRRPARRHRAAGAPPGTRRALHPRRLRRKIL